MLLTQTTNLQNFASNPQNSVFVAASAGSGKTRVLTNRVLRLLLLGVSPAKILCLTFTKVAATEMQKRIFTELENWLILSDEELKNKLKTLIEKESRSLDITRARKLFATLLDDERGLQISTIHSFCQGIIKKFPIEAKISPNFEVIDQNQENKLLLEARKELLKNALSDESLAKKINLISGQLNENSFLEITAELIKKRQNLGELKEQYFSIENVIEEVFKIVGVDLLTDEDVVFDEFINDKNWQKNQLQEICQATEVKSKETIKDFCNQPAKSNLTEYFEVFLTQENQPRKSLTNAAIRKQFIGVEKIMEEEQERVFQFFKKYQNVIIANSTAALLSVVDQIINIYSHLKIKNGYLDYNDLIIKTGHLLENSANREWVKYKLDGVFEHILVDESQDTNHHQWNIVKTISEEFFSGQSQDEQEKTIFIVGDEKQSIYSFQGADPDIFSNIFYYYQSQLNSVEKKFFNIELNSSFRSFPAILKIVDTVFSRPELAKSISSLAEKINHQAIFNQHCGKVVLFPLVLSSGCVVKEKETKKDQWQWSLDFEVDEEFKAQEILAKSIAKQIKNFFINRKFLASKNRVVEFGDVMILLKERKSNLGNLLVKHLQLEQIPVHSVDRINLGYNIIINDLLAVAKFILLPEDDLNLACLLKSAIVGISEEELLEICQNKEANLFASVQKTMPKIGQFLLDLLEKNQQQQFSTQQFFAYLLIQKNIKNKILQRSGSDAKNIIDQFLKLTFDYQNNNISPSMQGFVEFIETSDLEIKIENDLSKNYVKITTIHSAKGLEAPIVFLADTFHSVQKQFGNDRRRIFWQQETGLPFWSLGKNFDNQIIQEIKQHDKITTKKEYWRQLYVAMTRAEEELYVCGFGKESTNDCWYSAIKENILPFAKKENFDLLQGEEANFVDGNFLVFGEDFMPQNLVLGFKNDQQIIPQELSLEPILEEFEEELIYPSKLLDDDQNIDEQSVSLGKSIHKILELKIVDKKEMALVIEQYSSGRNFDEMEKETFISAILNVINEFSHLINHPNAKTEVPIMAKINDQIVSGKIDLLIVEENSALIIDYKTGKKDPSLNQQYQAQMQLYQQIIQKLYPNKKVDWKIIWINTALSKI